MVIKNIIFDLGGVIIDIDYNHTINAFRALGAVNFDYASFLKNHEETFFHDFETGLISSDAFRSILRSKFKIKINDSEFDTAWNAMLLDLPISRLEFIKKLKNEYKVFLFSNINEIHFQKVFHICQMQNGFNTFQDYFDREYYSHIFGKRKPSPAAFAAIIKENKINANETLFIDDTLQHIQGAGSAGLHTIHLTKDKSIFDVDNWLKNSINLNAT